ncbi:MAG: tRNA modification GTPase [Phycisphaerales bacterium]
MRTGDTIVALATGEGGGWRAIVRVSGVGVAGALRAVGVGDVERGERGGARVVKRRMGLGEWGECACLLMRSWGPRSYTGEETAELCFVGNVYVAREVVRLMTGVEGVRLAGPGEFTARAFLHGKLSAEQAEGVGMLIAARSEGEARAAERLLTGVTGERFRGWAEEIATCLALVEAGIDFTDQEDVVAIGAGECRARVGRLVGEMKRFVGEGGVREERQGLARIALVGRANAGKSTLFNALLGRERAVVSDVAGTTRDVLEEEVDLGAGVGGVRVRAVLMDLPGLERDVRGAADVAAQGMARGALGKAEVVVACSPVGEFAVGEGVRGDARVVRVRTKADVGVRGGEELAVCALDGWNVEALRRALRDVVEGGVGEEERMVLPRHRGAVWRTVERLEEALRNAVGERVLERAEVVAEGLRGALDAIGEVSGRISPDDVIGRIFATFCVGK